MEPWVLIYDDRCKVCNDQATVFAFTESGVYIPLCTKCFWVALKYKRVAGPLLTSDKTIMENYADEIFEVKNEDAEARQEYYKNAILGGPPEFYSAKSVARYWKKREQLLKRGDAIRAWQEVSEDKPELKAKNENAEQFIPPAADQNEDAESEVNGREQEFMHEKTKLIVWIAILAAMLAWTLIYNAFIK